MNKLRRFYNQNTKEIWITVIVIIFIISIIQLFDNFAREKNQEDIENSKNNTQEEAKYKNESQAIILGGNLSEKTQETYGTLIDTFLRHCVNKETEQAYQLLSEDCKELLYPTQELFEKEYCESKFEGDKTYSFQAWTTVREVIYYVKIFDNMLSTGVANTQTYKQDYISIVKENGEYKLNTNCYITKRERNVEQEKDNIKIKVNDTRVYMDYEIYSITIENHTDKDILLDSKRKTDTIYVKDENGITYEALLYENKDDDLKISAGKKKTIHIKFSNTYQANRKMKKIAFTDIISDYNEYVENQDTYEGKIEMEISW